MEVRALLLDVDGTVLDTQEFIVQAAEHALAQNGYAEVSRDKIAEAVGLSFDEFYFYLIGRSDVDPIPLQTSHRMFQLEHLDLSTPFPDAADTLSELKKRGYKLAAVTNRWRDSVITTLDNGGLTQCFDEIIAAGDIADLKPSPAPLLLAMERLHVTSEESVMIGDTDIDIAAGIAAGVQTVRVWYGFMGPRTEQMKADVSLENSIRELLDLFPPLNSK